MHGCLVPYYLVVDFDVQRFRQLLKDANPRATSLAANGGGIIDIFTQFCYNDINKSVFWLSVLLSLTIECGTQLWPKRFNAAVGTSTRALYGYCSSGPPWADNLPEANPARPPYYRRLDRLLPQTMLAPQARTSNARPYGVFAELSRSPE